MDHPFGDVELRSLALQDDHDHPVNGVLRAALRQLLDERAELRAAVDRGVQTETAARKRAHDLANRTMAAEGLLAELVEWDEPTTFGGDGRLGAPVRDEGEELDLIIDDARAILARARAGRDKVDHPGHDVGSVVVDSGGAQGGDPAPSAPSPAAITLDMLGPDGRPLRQVIADDSDESWFAKVVRALFSAAMNGAWQKGKPWESPVAASLFEPEIEANPDRRCGAPTTTDSGPCARLMRHDGPCAPVLLRASDFAHGLDLAVVDGLRARAADTELRLAATEDALGVERARVMALRDLVEESRDLAVHMLDQSACPECHGGECIDCKGFGYVDAPPSGGPDGDDSQECATCKGEGGAPHIDGCRLSTFVPRANSALGGA